MKTLKDYLSKNQFFCFIIGASLLIQGCDDSMEFARPDQTVNRQSVAVTSTDYQNTEPKGGFSGIIYDTNYTVIASPATLTFKKGGVHVLTLVTSQGFYYANLAPGTYQVTVSIFGYETYSDPGSTVVSSTSYNTYNFFMEPLAEI